VHSSVLEDCQRHRGESFPHCYCRRAAACRLVPRISFHHIAVDTMHTNMIPSSRMSSCDDNGAFCGGRCVHGMLDLTFHSSELETGIPRRMPSAGSLHQKTRFNCGKAGVCSYSLYLGRVKAQRPEQTLLPMRAASMTCS